MLMRLGAPSGVIAPCQPSPVLAGLMLWPAPTLGHRSCHRVVAL